jgi:predicted nucleotidyltransferase
MHQLTLNQTAIIERVTDALRPVCGLRALVLGGSYARGRAKPDSDIDLGLYYDSARPLDVDHIRALAAALDRSGAATVSGIYGWGRWVNGGAWLTIEAQRVDLLYRSVDDVMQVLAEARAGRYEIDTDQQPPFGFFSPTLLGEVAVAQPLIDPSGLLASLKAQVLPMPSALTASVVQGRLWQVEFGLAAFVPKFVVAADAYGVAGCLTRFAHALVLALFALNGTYLVNDKTALDEIDGFARAPADFSRRVRAALGAVGHTAQSQTAATAVIAALCADVRDLAGDLYSPPWSL